MKKPVTSAENDMRVRKTFQKSKAVSEKNSVIINKSIIAAGMELDDVLIKAGGSIDINGLVKGRVEIENDLELLSEGVVIGDIIAENAIISGNIKGNIYCRGFLEITQTANIEGNVDASSVEIEHGAIIVGLINIKPKQINQAVMFRY